MGFSKKKIGTKRRTVFHLMLTTKGVNFQNGPPKKKKTCVQKRGMGAHPKEVQGK
jgi:hypothetical protein